MKKRWRDEQICTHLGDDYERFHGAVVPPIYENSLFVYETYQSFLEAMSDQQNHYVYWRGTNPTVEIAEKKIAALEGGERCKLFASGMAAISASLLTFLQSGDHVLTVSTIYGPTTQFLRYLHKFKVSYTNILSTSLEAIEQGIREDTKVIYLESPTSITFQLVDIEAIVALAKAKGIKTIIDNTWATPIYQKPLQMGVDMVVHSASKYMGGHSDIVGGALITSKSQMDQIYRDEYQLLGGVMPPYEAWLLTRGLRTLPIRMKAHQENGLRVAQFLQEHPAVDQVNHPGLPSHPDYRLGRKQLSGYSGLFSFVLKNKSFSALEHVLNCLHLFQIGVSWGGFESLVMGFYNGHNEQSLERNGISPGLVRLSIGLEYADDLIQDIQQALDRIP